MDANLRTQLDIVIDHLQEVLPAGAGTVLEAVAAIEELSKKVGRLGSACEVVVATAHGNRYGLTTEDVLEAQLLAARECEEALGTEAVAKLAQRHGWVPAERLQPASGANPIRRRV